MHFVRRCLVFDTEISRLDCALIVDEEHITDFWIMDTSTEVRNREGWKLSIGKDNETDGFGAEGADLETKHTAGNETIKGAAVL
ncbi:hypothetical protein VTL71DRAFT_489 [Oculimacula yallundae]|uniref:Uncharacterized protein n=1 Tax=Oculimacula yallundae TaxID=86028 RepID=A0ABR4D1A8_9HELO